jgi:hypothetical protein
VTTVTTAVNLTGRGQDPLESSERSGALRWGSDVLKWGGDEAQGLQGAAEHLRDPSRLAWKSMCATDEGHQRGQNWCRKAIWGNTLPAFKRIFNGAYRGVSARTWNDVSTVHRDCRGAKKGI